MWVGPPSWQNGLVVVQCECGPKKYFFLASQLAGWLAGWHDQPPTMRQAKPWGKARHGASLAMGQCHEVMPIHKASQAMGQDKPCCKASHAARQGMGPLAKQTVGQGKPQEIARGQAIWQDKQAKPCGKAQEMHCTHASRLPPGDLQKQWKILVFLHVPPKGVPTSIQHQLHQ